MDDLVPLLIFLFIALVNLGKFALEKKAKKKPVPDDAQSPAPERKPSSLEAFFERLAEKLEPQPIEQPDWPEGYERPDYAGEQEAFEASLEEEPAEAAAPPPERFEPPPVTQPPAVAQVSGVDHARSLKTALRAMPSSVAGIRSMRIRTAPMLKSSGGRSIDFPLQNRTDLRRAVIANLIFSPPRAYDTSFDNTITK